MLRLYLLGDRASRGSAPATWTLDDHADHVVARMREPVHELLHVVDHSVGSAVEPHLARTGEGLQMARSRSTQNFCKGAASGPSFDPLYVTL
jgi:hypothetical protein